MSDKKIDLSDHLVACEVDGVVYRGRNSVVISHGKIFIDGRRFGIQCDKYGNDLAPEPRLPEVSFVQESGWQRFRNWLMKKIGA